MDGGGTKTELLLCRRDGRILARLRTEGCNPNDIGLEPAFAILSSGIRRLLELGDILVDGPYLEAQRSLELKFRGSRNQRVIDLPASLAAGKAVLSPVGEK